MRTWLMMLTAALGATDVRATPTGDPAGPDRHRGDVVARVNGEPVTRAELAWALRPPVDVMEPAEVAPAAGDPTERERSALRAVVERRLLLQEARRRGIEAPEKDVDQALLAMRRRFGDLGDFGAWMQQRGLDEHTLVDALRTWIVEVRVRAALVVGARVGDEQITRYHAEHAQELQVPGDVRLRIIAVRDRPAADEVVAALRGGASFGNLARERSLGSRARRGGDTGWVDPGKLPEPLRSAVRDLDVNAARGPLQRGDEFLVVALAGRRPPRPATLAEARKAIEARLLPAAQRAAIDAWLAERRAASSIEVLEPSLAGQAMTKTAGKGRSP